MRFSTNIRAVARVVARMRAATTRCTLWVALSVVALPSLAGADDPCSSATAAANGHPAEIRAEVECAPSFVRRDDVAAARGSGTGGGAYAVDNSFAGQTGWARSEALPVRRSAPSRAPDPPPVVKSSWTNTLGAEFVWIPAGKFIMGSPADEAGREPDEVQHSVTISTGYWMGKHEVTQREWVAVMGANPSAPDLPYNGCVPECPVDRVSWDEVQVFIRNLNSRESGRGYVYRLPTEAEWEYAARAGTSGARYGEFDAIAWHSSNSGSHAHPVGGKHPNAWGLHDMHGNVSEWTADWYGPYPSGLVTDPTGPHTGTLRVGRSNAFSGGELTARAAWRGYAAPEFRSSGLGFRLVRTMTSWTNTLGMEFVWMRTGKFRMGSPDSEKGRRQDEIQHPVQFGAGYWLGKYEVTRAEWRQVMGSVPPAPPHCRKDCPVASVSWEDAQEFIRKLHGRESRLGTRYRLPTEAEWEYAARAGTTGARYGELDKIAWYAGNTGGKLSPVGRKRANAWGLHDMLGNVGEWTADWYGAYRTYNGFAAVDPKGPRKGSLRVYRGGSYNEIGADVRAAGRRSGSPRSRDGSVGFRLVMSVPRSKR